MTAHAEISRCSNGHYFLGSQRDVCPHCGASAVASYEYRSGDCVACGALCPDGAYCCDTPQPVASNEIAATTNEHPPNGNVG